MSEDKPKYPIAEFSDTYWDEIRNPQLITCAEEIEEVCRKYGIRDIEFKELIANVEASLFSFIDLLSDEDEDDSEDLL